jgi:hypothetical protein
MIDQSYSKDLDITLIPESKNLSYYCILLPYGYMNFPVNVFRELEKLMLLKGSNTYLNKELISNENNDESNIKKDSILLKVDMNEYNIEEFLRILKSSHYYRGHYSVNNDCFFIIKVDSVLVEDFIKGNYSAIFINTVYTQTVTKSFYDKFMYYDKLYYNKKIKHPILYALSKSKNYFENHIIPYYCLDDTLDEKAYNNLFSLEFFNPPIIKNELFVN